MPKQSYIGTNQIETHKVRGWQATKKGQKNLIKMYSDKQTPRIDLHLETDNFVLEPNDIGESWAVSRSRPVVGGGAAVGGGVLPWVGTIAAAQLMAVGLNGGFGKWVGCSRG